MSRYLIVTRVDTNDADYVTGVEEISFTKVHQVAAVIEKLKKVRKSDIEWPRAEYMDKAVEEVYSGILDADEIHLIDSVTPNPEGGFHTIESIHVYTIEEETKLL